MQKVTAICYFFTLLFYGMGYFKTLVIRNAVPEHITTYDYTISITMATVYFVLAILFAVIGSLFLYVKSYREMTSDRRENPHEIYHCRPEEAKQSTFFNISRNNANKIKQKS